jgi:putative ABC transport system ATP-binding protein
VPEINLAARQVSVSFGSDNIRVSALKEVSLEFARGELTLIMGPSGSGKTTLLSVLGCLQMPDSGSVSIDGTDVRTLDSGERTVLRRRRVGFIFQAFRLFHALTAFENVMLSADVARCRNAGAEEAARQLLEGFGLADRLHLKPKALSGGEKQRVAIARALLSKPAILLADEPTASLDSTAGRQICTILRSLADEQHRTVVVVSHDPRWNEFAHRTVVLEDGRVIADRSNLR